MKDGAPQGTLRKLADALSVTVGELMDESAYHISRLVDANLKNQISKLHMLAPETQRCLGIMIEQVVRHELGEE